jgi:hypothetical protein
MRFSRDDPRSWPRFDPLMIAHDVGRSRDRSTAVVGGNCPVGPRLLGITACEELPQGPCGSARASALAAVDRRYDHNALIIADLSNDASYAEALVETFGHRVIGLQISRNGDGMTPERRPVAETAMLIYTIGRNQLLELFQSDLRADLVRLVDDPMTRRACEQLANLETDIRDSGLVYKCPPGQHDDLGISCAMLGWAARHPHLRRWMQGIPRPRLAQPQRPTWAAFV